MLSDSIDDRVELPVLEVDDAEVPVGDRHARFSMYCVEVERVCLVDTSSGFSCTIQMDDNKISTATHVGVSIQSVWQSVSDVTACDDPPGEKTRSRRVHVSHPVKHNHIGMTPFYLLCSLCVSAIDFCLSLPITQPIHLLCSSNVCQRCVTNDHKTTYLEILTCRVL